LEGRKPYGNGGGYISAVQNMPLFGGGAGGMKGKARRGLGGTQKGVKGGRAEQGSSGKVVFTWGEKTAQTGYKKCREVE